MSWPWRVLGLSPDADERAVRRAYAAKLRTTRPDEDAEGFQALNEAYQAALDAIREREAEDAPDTPEIAWSASHSRRMRPRADVFAALGDEEGSQHAHVDDAPGSSRDIESADHALDHDEQAAPARFDQDLDSDDGTSHGLGIDIEESPTPQWLRYAGHGPPPLPPLGHASSSNQIDDPIVLADACIEQALASDATTLAAWLRARPEFWSLPLKARTARTLFDALEFHAPAMPAQTLAQLVEFFGFDDIANGIDGFRLDRLRRRILQAWTLRKPSAGARPAFGQRMAAELERPYRPWVAVLRGMIPGRPASVGRLLASLEIDGFGGMPQQFDPRQVAFWQAAANPARVSWQRLAIDLGRGLLIAAFLALSGTLGSLGLSQATGTALTPASDTFVFVLLATAALSLVYTLGRSYVAWYPADGWRHGRVFALMPLLAIGACWFDNGLEQTGAAIGLNLLAVGLTALRWGRHIFVGGFQYRFDWTHLLMAFFMLKLAVFVAGAIVLIVEVGAIVVVLAWGFEAAIFAHALYRSRR